MSDEPDTGMSWGQWARKHQVRLTILAIVVLAAFWWFAPLLLGLLFFLIFGALGD
jgi:hypothetical protein